MPVGKSRYNKILYIYPGTIKLSDAKVKRQGYKLALFGGGGVHFVSTLNFYTLF